MKSSPLLLTLLICAAAAVLEGICAGKNVKKFFSTITFPRYSAPLWVWSIIGLGYYLIFGFVLYRILRLSEISTIRNVAIAWIVVMMILNGLSNYVIFRARDLRGAFYIGALFPILDVTLLLFLLRLDTVAAAALLPYLIYRCYAVWWGSALLKANRGFDRTLPKASQ